MADRHSIVLAAVFGSGASVLLVGGHCCPLGWNGFQSTGEGVGLGHTHWPTLHTEVDAVWCVLGVWMMAAGTVLLHCHALG